MPKIHIKKIVSFVFLLLALQACQPSGAPSTAPTTLTANPTSTPVATIQSTPEEFNTAIPIIQNQDPTPTNIPNATPAETAGLLPWSYFSNPGGGGAFHTVGLRDDGLAIAGSDLSGAYLIRDVQNQASRWYAIGPNEGLTSTHVSAVGFHPADDNFIFLGTDSGIFRSADDAQTFEHVYPQGYIHDFAIVPNGDAPAVVYATYHPAWDSNQGEVLKSLDGGFTWSIVSQNLPDGLRIIKLLVHPTQPNTIYALSGEARFARGPAAVYRSTNGGTTWQAIATELTDVMDIAFDTQERLWLTTYEQEADIFGSLYVSTNTGDSWLFIHQIHGVLWPSPTGTLRLIDPRHQFPWDERNGVWESADDGVTWQQISMVEAYDFGWSPAYFAHLEGYDGAVRTLAFSQERVIWVNSQFAFGSFDGGRTFENVYTTQLGENQYASRGIDNIVFFDAAVSEAAADGTSAIYMAMYDMGCFRSLDGGTSWENCNVPEFTGNWEGAGGNSFTVLTDSVRAEVVWMTQVGDIGDPVTLLRSDHFGAVDSWQISNSGIPTTASINGLSIDPNSPLDQRTLFVTVAGDVYRSLDDGWTWEQVFSCGGCRFTAVSPHDSDIILAGGEDGLFRSMSAGDAGTWSAVHVAEMTGEVSADIWEWGWAGVRDIAFDPTTSGRVVVGVLGTDRGVFVSENNGESWNKVLTDSYVRDIHITPFSLFVASSSAWESGGYDPAGKGVMFSNDGGQTWQTFNDGLAWPFPAKFITLNEANETMLLAIQGPGFYVTNFR